ncbi:MAG: hypothetical protein SAJ72_24405 [Jaaginema sp. PMC 1080.18]|nr:hypothetical protein [Jaaginema sp. PMC 1080.18]
MKINPVILNFGLTTFSIVSSLIISTSEYAQAETDVYVDENCNYVSNSAIGNLPEEPWFYFNEIVYSRKFIVDGNTYWLYVANYGDGSRQFCVSKPDFVDAKFINASEINSQFIEFIEQDGNNSPIFRVQVREGQNVNIPFIDYRLDLSNPYQPVTTFIRRGCCTGGI